MSVSTSLQVYLESIKHSNWTDQWLLGCFISCTCIARSIELNENFRSILCEIHVHCRWHHAVVPRVQEVAAIERCSPLDISPHAAKPVYAPPFWSPVSRRCTTLLSSHLIYVVFILPFVAIAGFRRRGGGRSGGSIPEQAQALHVVQLCKDGRGITNS